MKKDTTASSLLVISMGFLFLYTIFNWKWSLIVALTVGAIGIFSTFLSKIIEQIWMKLTHILSFIMPYILLSVVFYLILFPISLISKLFTKDPLMLSKNYTSYFVDVDKKFEKQNLEKIW